MPTYLRLVRILYVDEAGCTGALASAHSPIQPVFAIVGVAVEQARLHELTWDWLQLKRRFFPALAGATQFLDWIRPEVKGSEIRKNVAAGNRNQVRHALGFIDKFMGLLSSHDARVLGRVWIKPIGAPFDGTAVYTSSVQRIFRDFHGYLEAVDDRGFVVADSRNPPKNTIVSHSIFTQKFRSVGDPVGRILEMPLFGHSDNHAGLQLADMVCSSLVWPMAVHAYCSGIVNSVHVRPGYERLRRRYGSSLRALQWRYQNADFRWTGGIVVSDPLGKRSGADMFRAP